MNFSFVDLDFYRILWRIVAGWPAYMQDGRLAAWRQMQTFAVLSSTGDFDSDSLNRSIQDHRLGLFFSRKWEAVQFRLDGIGFEYPLLSVYPFNLNVSNFATPKSQESQTYEVSFVAPVESVPGNGEAWDPAVHFSREEMASQLKAFAAAVSVELADFIYVDKAYKNDLVSSSSFNESFNPSFGGVAGEASTTIDRFLGWHTRRYVETGVAAGSLDRYSFCARLTNFIDTDAQGSSFSSAYRDDLQALVLRFTVNYSYCGEVGVDYDYQINDERLLG